METSVNISQFFAEKVILNLNLFNFYKGTDTDKVYNEIKQSCENDFQTICKKTKQDILNLENKLQRNLEIHSQLMIFDKNIFTYVSNMVEKSKQA